jgi:hypothetical protein
MQACDRAGHRRVHGALIAGNDRCTSRRRSMSHTCFRSRLQSPEYRPVLRLLNRNLDPAQLANISALVETHSVVPSVDPIASIPRQSGFVPEVSFPLLLGELLPESVERVLFLDPDLLVVDDVAKIWEAELGDKVIAAAVDHAIPMIDMGAELEEELFPIVLSHAPTASCWSASLRRAACDNATLRLAKPQTVDRDICYRRKRLWRRAAQERICRGASPLRNCNATDSGATLRARIYSLCALDGVLSLARRYSLPPHFLGESGRLEKPSAHGGELQA